MTTSQQIYFPAESQSYLNALSGTQLRFFGLKPQQKFRPVSRFLLLIHFDPNIIVNDGLHTAYKTDVIDVVDGVRVFRRAKITQRGHQNILQKEIYSV